jgi:hypothetical protein
VVAERDVIYRIKVLPDENNAREFQSIRKQLDEAIKASEKFAKQQEQAARQREKSIRQQAREEERATSKREREARKLAEERSRLRKAEDREREKFAREESRLEKQQATETKQTLREISQAKKRAHREEISQIRERGKTASRQSEKSKQAIQERRKAQQAAAAQAQKSEAMQEAAAGRTREAINTGTEAILKLGRGFAMAGLAGEENTEKMLRGLVKVQAAFDVLRGAVDVWWTLRTAADAYKTSLMGVAAAQSAVAISSGAAGAAGAGAARTASSGMNRAINLGVAGGVGAGGSAVGRILSGAALKMGGSVGLGAGGSAIPGLLGPAALKMGGSAGAGASAVSGALGAAGTSALVAVGIPLGVASGLDFLTGGALGINTAVARSAPYRMGGQAFANLGGAMGFFGSSMVARREDDLARSQIRTSMASFLEQRQVAQAAAQWQRQDLRRQAIGERTPGLRGIRAQQRIIGAEIASARETMAGMPEHHSGRIDFQQRIVQLAREQSRLAEERLSTEQQIAQEKIRAAKESLATSQRELETQQQIAQAAKGKIESARTSFGLMTREGMARAVQVFRKGRAGKQLSLEELRSLSSVRTEEAQSIIQRQAARRAREGGFDALNFASQERAEMLAAQQRAEEIQVSVETQRQKIDVNVRDWESLKAQLEQAVRQAMNLHAREAAREVEMDLRQSLQQQQDQFNRRQQELQSSLED